MDKQDIIIYDNFQIFSQEKANFSMTIEFKDYLHRLSCNIIYKGITFRKKYSQRLHPSPSFSRLFIFLEGYASITVANKDIKLEPNKLYFFPADMPFNIYYFPCTFLFFHLHIYDESLLSIFKEQKKLIVIEDYTIVTHFLEPNLLDNTLLVNAYIHMLVAKIIDGQQEKYLKQLPIHKFIKIFEYMKTHKLAMISISDLADLYDESANTLSVRFRRTMGYSLKHYITIQQIMKAEELLLLGNMNVQEISDFLGYKDNHYFYRFFKKHTGRTPSEYRTASLKS